MSSDSGDIFSFQELKVWQKAVDFAEKVILTVDDLDTSRKHYRLIEQLEAASTSVAMNIAEGKGRHSRKEFAHFLYIARGSLFEVVTLLTILKRLAWIDVKRMQEFEQLALEITKTLNPLIKALRK